MVRFKNRRTVLILATVIVFIAAGVIFIALKSNDSPYENMKTEVDTTKNNTRNIDSIDYEVEEDMSRARKVTTKIYIIEDFSDYYYGKVTVYDAGEYNAPGKAEIYSKKNNRKLLSVKSSTINWGISSSKPDTNIKIMYGEQDVIIYEDFNFDGIKDFAFLDGACNKYFTPSYTVYLILNRKIVHSKGFTNLASYYLGMFDVDRKRKIITVHEKGGCCYTAYKEYKVVNNSPAVVLIEEQEIKNNYLFKTTRKLLKNGKWSKKTTKEKAYRDY